VICDLRFTIHDLRALKRIQKRQDWRNSKASSVRRQETIGSSREIRNEPKIRQGVESFGA